MLNKISLHWSHSYEEPNVWYGQKGTPDGEYFVHCSSTDETVAIIRKIPNDHGDAYRWSLEIVGEEGKSEWPEDIICLNDVMHCAENMINDVDPFEIPTRRLWAFCVILLGLLAACLIHPLWFAASYVVLCYLIMSFIIISGELETGIIGGIIAVALAPIVLPLLVAFFAIRLPIL